MKTLRNIINDQRGVILSELLMVALIGLVLLAISVAVLVDNPGALSDAADWASGLVAPDRGDDGLSEAAVATSAAPGSEMQAVEALRAGS